MNRQATCRTSGATRKSDKISEVRRETEVHSMVLEEAGILLWPWYYYCCDPTHQVRRWRSEPVQVATTRQQFATAGSFGMTETHRQLDEEGRKSES